MKHNDLSNLLIAVDLKPIFSTTPSIIPSITITSPFLNLFSTNTKTPEIRFLNKSWAPRATATPNNPKPAIIGATFIPHISRTAEKPNMNNITFKALIIHSKRSFVKMFSIFLILKKRGWINLLIAQKIIIVNKEALILLIKFFIKTESFKKTVDIKKAIEKIRKLIGLLNVARKSLSFLGKKRLIFFFIRFLNKPFVNNIERKVNKKATYLSKLIPNS